MQEPDYMMGTQAGIPFRVAELQGPLHAWLS